MGADWYVGPGVAYGDGSGSANDPWNLQYALDHPAAIQPGDMVWLLPGTYNGHFESRLEGTAGKPIVVRSTGDGTAKIDGGTYNVPDRAILYVTGGYTWFWGIRVMSSSGDRTSAFTYSYIPPDISTTVGIWTPGSADPNETLPGLKFIDMIVHDTAEAFFMTHDAVGAEFHGNLVYYNGWIAPDRGHGHGLYFKNFDAETSLPIGARENIVFAQYGLGIAGYPDQAGYGLFDLRCEGNAVFHNGVLAHLADPSRRGFGMNFSIGDSPQDPVRPKLIDNYTYFAPTNPAAYVSPGKNRLGYTASTVDAEVRGNYFVTPYRPCDGARSLQFAGTGSIVMANNVFYGLTSDDPNDYDTVALWRNGYGNIFYDCGCWPPNPPCPLPTGVEVFVRRNGYEGDRGHVVVYNWDDVNTVWADMTGVLIPGDAYEVVDAQNYFGPPVASGVYLGGTIPIPTTSTAVPTSSGGLTPMHTPKQYGAFVVRRVFYQGEGPQPGGPGG